MSKKSGFQEDLSLYRRLFNHYIFPHWPAFIFALLGSAGLSGIDAGVTYLFKPFLDKGFIEKEGAIIRWAPLLIMLAFIIRGIAHFVSNYFTTWVARSVILKFRQQIFSRLLYMPAEFYDHHSSGQLLSKLLYDVEQIAKISTDSISELVQSLCLIIGLIAVMMFISWKLTLVYLVTLPIIATVIRIASKRVRRLSRSGQQIMSSVTEIAEESIEGYRVVKIFGGQEYERKKFYDTTIESRKRDMKVEVTKCFSVSGVQLVAASGISIIVYLAISPHSTMLLSAGGFVSMIVAMLSLLRPMKNLTTVNAVIQRGLAGAQSVFALLDESTEPDLGTIELETVKGDIRYEDVGFYYQDASKKVLKNINFHIQPGQTVAFVGKSGGGKSTLVSLLPRFYEIKSGAIYLDNIKIQDLTLKNLRKHIALVTQHVTLFNDTIAKNIAYGSFENVTEQQIKQAAYAAHAMEFIETFPEGLNTKVGENGVLLSGGQRQRIAIARALLKNAPILILDEATSALDTESERHIQEALENLMKTRTTLVIAHRLSTIERADLILVVDNGEIIERGTHQDLLQKGGAYAKLYEMQFSPSISNT